MEFVRIRDINDPLAQVMKDDPVRPHIPLDQRINDAAEILILKAGEEVLAATCMQWLSSIPETEEDLQTLGKDHCVAVFYTIWSYSPGAGATLLQQAAEWLKQEYQTLTSIVTLSPKTEMARRFHIKNGASVFRDNLNSVNYRYYQKKEPDVDTENP